MPTQAQTYSVSDDVFRRCTTPRLRYRWLTRDEDVRRIEQLLGIPPGTIGARLRVSGDRRRCAV